jgi:mortality factor 4-like protein 1
MIQSSSVDQQLIFYFIVSMPELVAQTNMDPQSVNKLREELTKLTGWLSKNSSHYFVAEYETASQEYVEKARGI